jgi:hypothetical protein
VIFFNFMEKIVGKFLSFEEADDAHYEFRHAVRK